MTSQSLTTKSTLDVNRQQFWSESDSFTVERYRQFARHLPKEPIRVLDCGCNTGRGGNVLRQSIKEATLYGIDLVPERIAQIPRNIYEQVVAGSTVQMPFDAEFFDAIVAGEFVEHVDDSDLLATFREFRRVLKPTGRILLTTPNPTSYMITMAGRTHIFDDPSHVNIMTLDQLKRKLENCGLNMTGVVGSGRATRYVGERFPLFNVYGSYLAIVVP